MADAHGRARRRARHAEGLGRHVGDPRDDREVLGDLRRLTRTARSSPSAGGGRRRAPLYPEVGTVAGALLRGLRKRCPRCGERDTFVSWFVMRTAARDASGGSRRKRAATSARWPSTTRSASLLWIVVLDRRAGADGARRAGVAAARGERRGADRRAAVFYPRSKTIWAAVEYLVLRTDPTTGRRFVATRGRATWSEALGDGQWCSTWRFSAPSRSSQSPPTSTIHPIASVSGPGVSR